MKVYVHRNSTQKSALATHATLHIGISDHYHHCHEQRTRSVHTVTMDHLLSTNNCKLLKCALEVIDRTKSADTMRITTVPVDNFITAKPTTSATKTNPNSNQNEHQGREQRRKEKKRRKIELRKQRREISTITSEVVTTTSLRNFCSNTTSSVSSDSTTTVSVPQPVRAIIHVKPLIILDVNGILCHRLRQKYQELQLSPASYRRTISFRPSIGHVANTDIVPRSDLHQFLTLLNNNFSLAVCKYYCSIFAMNVYLSMLYLCSHLHSSFCNVHVLSGTSATRKTAKQLVRLLFPDEIRENLVFIWHRNFCNLVDSTDKGKPKMESDSSEETQKKPSHEDLIAIKSLAKVWASYPIWNATNTLLLDDSPEKCPIKYRKNALHPVQISGTTTNIEGGAYFDNDEENEKNQRSFFELLANDWSES